MHDHDLCVCMCNTCSVVVHCSCFRHVMNVVTSKYTLKCWKKHSCSLMDCETIYGSFSSIHIQGLPYTNYSLSFSIQYLCTRGKNTHKLRRSKPTSPTHTRHSVFTKVVHQMPSLENILGGRGRGGGGGS